jgi:hypothetical protein
LGISSLRSRTARVGNRLGLRSAVDDGHVPFVVTFAGGRGEVVEPFDLFGAQLDAIGGRVLLDAGHPLGAGPTWRSYRIVGYSKPAVGDAFTG